MTIFGDHSDHLEESAAAPIIKKIALDILRSLEGQDVPLRQIRDAVFELTQKRFTHGSFSGAMRDLIEENDGRVINTERGFYRYESNVKKREINNAIENLILSLDRIATANILKISNEDIEIIRKIPEIQARLSDLKID